MIENKEVVKVTSQFGEILAFQDDLITSQIETFGNHTRPEFAFAQSLLDFDHNVFDIGGHIGTFSIAALSKMQPGTRLLAVEGNPVTFELLKNNIASRGHAKVDLLNSFCGTSSDGFSYAENLGNTGASRLVKSTAGEDQVSMIPLDDLARDYFTPDYVKIDIEGAEYSALQNSQMIRDAKPIVYMEVAEHLSAFGHDSEMLNELFQSLGYVFYVNTGRRNAKHDVFGVKQIPALHKHAAFFDVLCVPENSEAHRALRYVAPDFRLSRVVARKLRASATKAKGALQRLMAE